MLLKNVLESLVSIFGSENDVKDLLYEKYLRLKGLADILEGRDLEPPGVEQVILSITTSPIDFYGATAKFIAEYLTHTGQFRERTPAPDAMPQAPDEDIPY